VKLMEICPRRSRIVEHGQSEDEMPRCLSACSIRNTPVMRMLVIFTVWLVQGE